MLDPLSFLRDFHMHKKRISRKDNKIIFKDYAWPRDVKTNYCIGSKAKKGNKKGKQKQNTTQVEYYTLECLLYFLRHVKLPHPEYCELAQREKVLAVRRVDRKNLLKYLNGGVSTPLNIDISVPPPPVFRVIHTKANKVNTNPEPPLKRPKLEPLDDCDQSKEKDTFVNVKIEKDMINLPVNIQNKKDAKDLPVNIKNKTVAKDLPVIIKTEKDAKNLPVKVKVEKVGK